MVGRMLSRGAKAGALLLLAEAAYAVLRPAPRQIEFDPSGVFGDPRLPPFRVAVLGDSSVTGPGVSGPDEIWVSRVCARLGERHHVRLRSFAVGGSKAEDVIRDQLGPAIAYRPHLTLVAVGANDVLRGVRADVFASRLEHIVSQLSGTGTIVVLSGVGDMGSIPRLQPPLSRLISRRSGTFDRIHHSIAARHGAHVVDQRNDDPEIWYRDRGLWSPDLFHVSAAGHARWAEVTWRTIEPLLDGVGGPG